MMSHEKNVQEIDEEWMRRALQYAVEAEEVGEVPIGAVLVHEGLQIAGSRNRREQAQSALAHAELDVIQQGCEVRGSWRLENCTLYVTLEPCPMCAGAIVQSRIPRVVFGAYDPKAGCCGTLYQLCNDERFNHRAECVGGVLEKECGELLSDFFRQLRTRKKAEKQKHTQ
ncbi:tRNA adenosine(34) deaminase TadA [Bacillus fonticola]|uniref:tRNA adenosine(34) deaminase TadA n=1 Tax=Bacillus fonticola TaxID=2728853 RepID=UPI001D13E883|nr:tRNA adenosine(34) deaminase TadA [Bacillus fonticola]